jgi:hypothetical protein
MSGRLHPDNRAKHKNHTFLQPSCADCCSPPYGAARLYGFLFGKRHQGSANPGPSEFLVDNNGAQAGNTIRPVKPFHDVKAHKTRNVSINLHHKSMMTFLLRKNGDLFGYLLRRQLVTKLLKQTSNNRAVADGNRTNANILLHAECVNMGIIWHGR